MKTYLNKKGFSLIELIVVIAIIAIIAGIVVTNVTSSRSKARDAKRISDIANLQLALEQYYAKNNKYPAGLNNAINPNELIPEFISSIPKDPSTKSDYIYALKSGGFDYLLKAVLENDNEALQDSWNANATFVNNYGLGNNDCLTASRNYCVRSK